MISNTDTVTLTAAKLRAVQTACNRMPAGPQKDAALRHFLAADENCRKMNHAEAIRQLDAASVILFLAISSKVEKTSQSEMRPQI